MTSKVVDKVIHTARVDTSNIHWQDFLTTQGTWSLKIIGYSFHLEILLTCVTEYSPGFPLTIFPTTTLFAVFLGCIAFYTDIKWWNSQRFVFGNLSLEIYIIFPYNLTDAYTSNNHLCASVSKIFIYMLIYSVKLSVLHYILNDFLTFFDTIMFYVA